MNFLIDIGHPAHVHYYKNLARDLEKKGHSVIWTVKDIPVAKHLLDVYGFKFIPLPTKAENIIGKIMKQIQYDLILLRICKKYRIDVAIGTSVSIAHISVISKVKSVVFDDDDDEVQPLVTKYVNPFASSLLSPEALTGKRKRKDTLYYPGYHELAYLHPKRFSPEISVLAEAGLMPNEPFFIMRFNVFKAHHDIGVKGLSLEQKLQLVDILKPHGKIFITTERNIETELKEYQLKIKPEKIHSLLSYATLFLGDSQTMTSEAAMLGTPSLRCNSFAKRISYLNEQEQKYGLTFAYEPESFQNFVEKLKSLIDTPNLKKDWLIKRNKMLSEKIDVTAFWTWFLENYPESISNINTNKDIWLKFK